MKSSTANFALIGRAYPSEMFELWSQMSRSARERRKAARARQPMEAATAEATPFRA